MESESMTDPNHREIYIQRYETFRHLDSMRYQIQNIAILMGTLFAAYVAGAKQDYNPAIGMVVGLVLMAFGFTMWRISEGIVGNSKVLKEAGEKIGDTGLPQASLSWKTATFWTTALTFVFGLALALFSGWNLCSTLMA